MGHKTPLLFTDPPDRLCVVRLSAIGDCCHIVPVIRSLQTAWPETRIIWVIGRMEAGLLGDLDGVECITFDRKAGLAGYLVLHREMHSDRHYDALLLLFRIVAVCNRPRHCCDATLATHRSQIPLLLRDVDRRPDAMSLITLADVTGRLDQLMATSPALRLRDAEPA